MERAGAEKGSFDFHIPSLCSNPSCQLIPATVLTYPTTQKCIESFQNYPFEYLTDSTVEGNRTEVVCIPGNFDIKDRFFVSFLINLHLRKLISN
jgi:hypothetical protein